MLATATFVPQLAILLASLLLGFLISAVGFELRGFKMAHLYFSLDGFGGRFAGQFEAPTLRGIGAVVYLFAVGGFESALSGAAGEENLHDDYSQLVSEVLDIA